MPTGKEIYEERRRLQAENKLHRERRIARQNEDQDEAEELIMDMANSIARLADAAERIAAKLES